MQVLKFGGSSIAHSNSIQKICNLLEKKPIERQYLIVVSALGNITDQLIKCGKLASKRKNTYKNILKKIEIIHINIIRDLFTIKNQNNLISWIKKNINNLESLCDGIFQVKKLSKQSLDEIMSFGELSSSFLISEKLREHGLDTICKDSRDLIITDSQFGCAQVNFIDSNYHIIKFFSKKKPKYVVLPGFIGSTKEKKTTTLGRGGSDYTASILAAATSANLLEIWTDVSGIMTANPKIVKNAIPIKEISYEEAMELSHFGAKVIYPPTIQPAMKKKIPIKIKNTFYPNDPGTLIYIDKNINISKPVTGISGIKNISLLILEGNICLPEYSKRLFEALLRDKINVIFIKQSFSKNSIITVVIYEMDVIKAKKLINYEFYKEINKKKIKPLKIENDLCIIAVVGDNMKNIHCTSGKIFSSLGRNNINVRAIVQGSTEKNILAVIQKRDFEKALKTLHVTFFESKPKQINLFICGLGKVGSTLLKQINKQKNIYYKN